MTNQFEQRPQEPDQVGRDARGLGDLAGGDGLGGLGAWSESAPAPGAALPPFRPSLSLQRTRFSTDLEDGSTATVDVDHTEHRASLYVEGRHVRTAEMPTRFAVGDEGIEVAATRYGMSRIHLVGRDGAARRLDPAPGTPEHWRARLGARHPRVARMLAAGAVLVLVVNLVLLAPQLLEVLTHASVWADRFPSFVSPVDLPAWANTALTLTASLAALERALTFRHHRLLDVETDGIDA